MPCRRARPRHDAPAAGAAVLEFHMRRTQDATRTSWSLDLRSKLVKVEPAAADDAHSEDTAAVLRILVGTTLPCLSTTPALWLPGQKVKLASQRTKLNRTSETIRPRVKGARNGGLQCEVEPSALAIHVGFEGSLCGEGIVKLSSTLFCEHPTVSMNFNKGNCCQIKSLAHSKPLTSASGPCLCLQVDDSSYVRVDQLLDFVRSMPSQHALCGCDSLLLPRKKPCILRKSNRST